MTRTLFFFMAAAAMLATMTAILIRIEMAYPDVSPLFLDMNGNPDTHRFNSTSTAHSVFAYVTAMLLGCTMAAAARDRGAPLLAPVIWIGIAISVVTLGVLILSSLDAPASAPAGVGWVLYPPLSGPSGPSALDHLTTLSGLDPILLGQLTNLLFVPAIGFLLFGAFALLSTEPGFRVLPFFALPLILLSLAGLIGTGTGSSGFYAPLFSYLAILALVACAAIRLIDAAPSWLVVMMVGLFASIAAHTAILLSTAPFLATGTMVEIALHYIFPLGLTFYALPALILYTRRPQLRPATPWFIGVGLTFGLAVWIFPIFLAGRGGQPMRYIDFPKAYEAQNLAASAGVIVFTLGYLALITWLRRKPRGA